MQIVVSVIEEIDRTNGWKPVERSNMESCKETAKTCDEPVRKRTSTEFDRVGKTNHAADVDATHFELITFQNHTAGCRIATSR